MVGDIGGGLVNTKSVLTSYKEFDEVKHFRDIETGWLMLGPRALISGIGNM